MQRYRLAAARLTQHQRARRGSHLRHQVLALVDQARLIGRCLDGKMHSFLLDICSHAPPPLGRVVFELLAQGQPMALDGIRARDRDLAPLVDDDVVAVAGDDNRTVDISTSGYATGPWGVGGVIPHQEPPQ